MLNGVGVFYSINTIVLKPALMVTRSIYLMRWRKVAFEKFCVGETSLKNSYLIKRSCVAETALPNLIHGAFSCSLVGTGRVRGHRLNGASSHACLKEIEYKLVSQ